MNVIPKACRNCRIRKVRCNRAVPCSNCVISKIACPGTAKPVARQSSSEEARDDDKSFEQLQKRIAAIEELLKNKTSSANKADSDSISTLESLCKDHSIPFEGESSFSRQAMIVNQIEELQADIAIQSPGLLYELSNFRHVLKDQESSANPTRVCHRCPSPIIEQLKAELPPADFVIRLLGTVPDEHSLLTLFFPIQCGKQIEELCKRVYFPVEPVSVGDLTLLNALLYTILSGFKYFPRPELPQNEIDNLYSATARNLQAGIETYEVAAIPTYEHALLLCIAANHAQMAGVLSLQWRLTSIAARHCLALGYHREAKVSSLPFPDSVSVRRLFWHIYFLDKSLVLSLGRASVIQDFDVDVEPTAISEDPGRAPWDTAFATFVELSKIQAQIYEALYSRAARRLDFVKRQAIVSSLSERLGCWYNTWQQLDASKAYHKDTFDITFGPAGVAYYSLLTQIHRGSSSAHVISPECFEAARKGLQAHASTYAQYALLRPKSLPMFASWVHVNISFAPYIATFLHCIGDPSLEDVRLLERALEILKAISSLVDACKHQYELCSSLYGIAEAYVNSSRIVARNEGQRPGENLGLSPQDMLEETLPWNESDLLQTDCSAWSGRDFGQAPLFSDVQVGASYSHGSG